jgi:hypothetical protein
VHKIHPFLLGLTGGFAILWLAPIAAAVATAVVQALVHALKEYQFPPSSSLPFLVSYLPALLVALLVACVVFRGERSRLAALLGLAVPLIATAMFTGYLLGDESASLMAVLGDAYVWMSIANVALGLGLAMLITRRRKAAISLG